MNQLFVKKRVKQVVALTMSIIMVLTSFTMYPNYGFAQNGAYDEYYVDPFELLQQAGQGPYNGQHTIPNPMLGQQPQAPGAINPLHQLQPQGSSGQPGNIPIPPTSIGNTPDPLVDTAYEPPVDIASGQLRLSEVDFDLPGVQSSIKITRQYQSDNQELGPFGKGWVYPIESRLRMHAEYAISEFRIDGSTQPFSYVITDEDAYIVEYDGDELINYELHVGHYEQSETGDTLERISRYEYVVTTPKGEKYTYYSYEAPWREDQDPKEGRMIKMEDRYGNVTSFDYNADGNVERITDSVGRSVEFTWDGEVITHVKDPENYVTEYQYDSQQRLKTVIYPDGSKQHYEYDAQDRIRNVQDGEGHSFTFEYNDEHQVTQVKGPKGNVLYTYTRSGNSVTKTNLYNESWTYTVEDDKVKSVRNPLGEVTTYQHNGEGKVILETSPRGTTERQYDDEGRLRVEKLPNGQVNRYTFHDKWDRVEQVQNVQGQTTFCTTL